ncbi:hypothetical protein GDO81_015618 [Engystomops pustulosus]|uniref:CSC1/OSCA1-like cytosolic domain-containing protein n=1 Tax=Engystomops pustulosus TaxID=76066 RepID=A0AAV7AQA1_ENGPU|nr:hypothetical protein GDO81_015618 [Engystomops pustulosus]
MISILTVVLIANTHSHSHARIQSTNRTYPWMVYLYPCETSLPGNASSLPCVMSFIDGNHLIYLLYFNFQVVRTLMVTHIPREISDPSLITKHFHEAYPSCTVTDVQFSYDVRRLMKLDTERRQAMKGRLYFAGRSQKEGRIMIKTHPCARICPCDCCGFQKVR